MPHLSPKATSSAKASVQSLALLDVYGRIAHTLLNLAKEKHGTLMIEQRLTHQDIANMVGASQVDGESYHEGPE